MGFDLNPPTNPTNPVDWKPQKLPYSNYLLQTYFLGEWQMDSVCVDDDDDYVGYMFILDTSSDTVELSSDSESNSEQIAEESRDSWDGVDCIYY